MQLAASLHLHIMVEEPHHPLPFWQNVANHVVSAQHLLRVNTVEGQTAELFRPSPSPMGQRRKRKPCLCIRFTKSTLSGASGCS